MRTAVLLFAAFAGLVAAQGDATVTPPNERDDIGTSHGVSFYTRMSFYTPNDGQASIVIDAAPDGQSASANADLVQNIDNAMFSVTGPDDNSVVPWQPLHQAEGKAFDVSFPLDSFPPRSEPYTLHLYVVSGDGQPLVSTNAALHVLSEDDSKSLARKDRVDGHIYTPVSADQAQAEQAPQAPAKKKQDGKKGGKKGSNKSVKGKKKPGMNPDKELFGTQTTPPPGPLLMKGPHDHEGSLPMGWWRKVLPSTVHETTWNHVQKSWRAGNLTHFVEDIKLGGTNVIHVKGPKPISVPFEADLRYHLSKCAGGHKVYVLFDVDFRSPGSNFKKYYTESHEPPPGMKPEEDGEKKPEESKEEPKKEEPKKEEPKKEVKRSVGCSVCGCSSCSGCHTCPYCKPHVDRRNLLADASECWDEKTGHQKRDWVSTFIANHRHELGLSHEPTHKHAARDDAPPAWTRDTADGPPDEKPNVPVPGPKDDAAQQAVLALHAISQADKERIAWEATDTLRRVMDTSFASHMPRDKPEEDLKHSIAMDGVQTLRRVINSYFTPTGEVAPAHPSKPRRRDIASFDDTADAVNPSGDANTTATRERGPRCGGWFPANGRADANANTPWPCRLAEHEKADIVLRFKRNVKEMLDAKSTTTSNKAQEVHTEENWENDIMQKVHRDIMTAFERKVKDSVDEWFKNPSAQRHIPPTSPHRRTPSDPVTDPDKPLGAKAPTGTTYADTDSDDWEHRILSEMHKDVLEAFETRVRADLGTQNNKRAGPTDSARKAERVVKTRSLKKLLEAFDRCQREGECGGVY